MCISPIVYQKIKDHSITVLGDKDCLEKYYREIKRNPCWNKEEYVLKNNKLAAFEEQNKVPGQNCSAFQSLCNFNPKVKSLLKINIPE